MYKDLDHTPGIPFRSKLFALTVIVLLSLAASLLIVRPTYAATTSQLTINNPVVGLGERVWVNGSGFMPGEEIALWLTAPNGSAVSYGRTYTSAHEGTFSNYYSDWADDALIFPGKWYVTAQGLESGQKAITSFTMVRPSLAASTLGINASQTNLEVSATNWYPGERLSFWITDSTGQVQPLGYAWVYQDGSIIEGKTFDFQAIPGEFYRLTAYGNTSGRTVITSFTGP